MKPEENKEEHVPESQPVYPTLNEADPPPYPGLLPSRPASPGGIVLYQVTPERVVTPIALASTVIVDQPLGPTPSTLICRSCHQETTTRVRRNPTIRTHLMAILLCVFGLWFCACLPYCADTCLNLDHYCTNCDAYLGTYRN
ncbi:lipopolysaccharide-induced tumor necrosis factor-alpha factor homolog [Achroia grisella]|uniref:lipopolysaccharide-induced tumor necrosis factor-alpha factor homolog n=1 Tax=Achroia grisella TaxID=688607 RepID=UPI0027D23B13|nr:lipopolysaccharide-induced tumor necrosis factor-alpha factor homolog [Achroia grisella]